MQFNDDMAEQVRGRFDPVIARDVAGGIDGLQVDMAGHGGAIASVLHGRRFSTPVARKLMDFLNQSAAVDSAGESMAAGRSNRAGEGLIAEAVQRLEKVNANVLKGFRP